MTLIRPQMTNFCVWLSGLTVLVLHVTPSLSLSPTDGHWKVSTFWTGSLPLLPHPTPSHPHPKESKLDFPPAWPLLTIAFEQRAEQLGHTFDYSYIPFISYKIFPVLYSICLFLLACCMHSSLYLLIPPPCLYFPTTCSLLVTMSL